MTFMYDTNKVLFKTVKILFNGFFEEATAANLDIV